MVQELRESLAEQEAIAKLLEDADCNDSVGPAMEDLSQAVRVVKETQTRVRSLLAAKAEKEVSVVEKEGDWSREVKTKWSETKSGGCMNNPTWRQNPQILLKEIGRAHV